MVDLQAATGDGYRSLTEGSVAETEAQVQRLLRMSYDTFVNSAFLLQGEADRFTTSKPAQRKETLADILGLSLYERLQDRAKERVREYDAQLLRNQVDRDAAERELANRPGVEQSLDDARRMLEGLAPLLSVARAEEAALEARVASLERVQEEADRLRESVGQRTAEAERLEAQAAQARDRAARYSNVLARRAEILDGAGQAGRRRSSALRSWVRLSSRTQYWSGKGLNLSTPLHRRRTGWPRRPTGCGTAWSANCAQGWSAGRRRRQLLRTRYRPRL